MTQSQMSNVSLFHLWMSWMTAYSSCFFSIRHKYETTMGHMALQIFNTQKNPNRTPVDQFCCLSRFLRVLFSGLQTVLHLWLHVASSSKKKLQVHFFPLSHFHHVQLWFLLFEEESWLQPKFCAIPPISSTSCMNIVICPLRFCSTISTTAKSHPGQTG